MDLWMKAVLLEKEVIANGNKIPVYGLAHFKVGPRYRDLGSYNLKAMELIAIADGKKCIVAFCDDKVLPFYNKCGWYVVGRKGKANIISSHPLVNIQVEEQW